MTPKYSPILWWPQKNIHKIVIPQKIFIFLKTPKNIEIQNFEPKKMTRAYVCMKILEYPQPPPQPPRAQIPTLSRKSNGIWPFAPPQGHQFDPRVNFFIVSWSADNPI